MRSKLIFTLIVNDLYHRRVVKIFLTAYGPVDRVLQ